MESPTGLIVRGVLGVVVGVLAFFWPGITLAALVILFGVYAFLDGIVNLTLGFSRAHGEGRSWGRVLLGCAGIAAGLLTVLVPRLTLFVLIMYIAAWAIIRGAVELAAAIRLRHVITGEWLLALSGMLSILFGLLVFIFPGAGALTIAWMFAIYAFAVGILLIALGFRLRGAVAA
jgi:uncharacterized membrane protein HdeD (DUF308 family)